MFQTFTGSFVWSSGRFKQKVREATKAEQAPVILLGSAESITNAHNSAIAVIFNIWLIWLLYTIPDASSLGFSLNTRFVRGCIYRLMPAWLELPLSVFQQFSATLQEH